MKMVDWVEENYDSEKETCSVLDLGCGNGHLLLDLAELGFEDLTGIDYSPAAIELARAVAKDKELDHIIKYEAVDFLAEKETLGWCTQQAGAEGNGLPKKFKVLLDKGTYDAISLHQKNKRDADVTAAAAAAAATIADSDGASKEAKEEATAETAKTKDDIVLAENDDNMEELADRYPKRVASMMQDDGRLLITSCNWTQAELIQRFSQGLYRVCREPIFSYRNRFRN
ncbi:S-adenosyl-L-methionine-dependent methyltransferase [Gamsiella multidivaricata]|uniref:S-adenosyl-L-methionine-dependent methyltransferase n=1 Tax=Gamsiella multidivaricata TaxID=101098 RepID=UPI00222051C3|nr:S-adenosyl-L-methionine-dependent methyltransferase [Gamsiella multidivaricata]KAI7818758.1 S-adenosyl-L-methionine-dependent methyltransferase [Gamsiella multidivaricata]